MLIGKKLICSLVIGSAFLYSCKIAEKAAVHGLNSGYYTLKEGNKIVKHAYLDITNEHIDVYQHPKQKSQLEKYLTIALDTADTVFSEPIVLKKQSLDMDITSILFKYRPSLFGLPAQLNTDFNLALYVGWRYDTYQIKSKKDPLGKIYQKIDDFGFDFGIFVGPGTTLISPFTTLNKRTDEYSGMIIQAGIAGFLESKMASFGLSIGYDHLMNTDRRIWIYQNRPWVGFVVGIALN